MYTNIIPYNVLKNKFDTVIDELLIQRGEHPTRVRNLVYDEERELAKDFVKMLMGGSVIGVNDYTKTFVNKALDQLLVERGEKKENVRHPLYSEQRKLALDFLCRMLEEYYEIVSRHLDGVQRSLDNLIDQEVSPVV